MAETPHIDPALIPRCSLFVVALVASPFVWMLAGYLPAFQSYPINHWLFIIVGVLWLVLWIWIKFRPFSIALALVAFVVAFACWYSRDRYMVSRAPTVLQDAGFRWSGMSVRSDYYISRYRQGRIEKASHYSYFLKTNANWPDRMISLAKGKYRTDLRRWGAIFNTYSTSIALTQNYQLEQLPPRRFFKIPNLEAITLRRVPNLLDLEGINGSIKSLEIKDCQSLQSLAGIEALSKLEVLELQNLPELVDLSGAGQLKNLRRIEIRNAENLESISDLSNCSKLESIIFNQLPKAEGYGYLEDCHELRSITIDGALLDDLKSFGSLSKLRALNLRNCMDLVEIRELPFPELHTFIIADSGVRLIDTNQLKSIANIERIYILRNQLSIGNFGALHHSLRDLTIPWQVVQDDFRMNQLKSVTIQGEPKLLDLQNIAGPIEDLKISNCQSFESLAGIEKFSELKELKLIDLPGLTDLSGIGQLKKLERIEIRNLGQLTSVAKVAGCSNLQYVILNGLPIATGYGELGKCKSLLSLAVDDGLLDDLSPFNSLKELKALNLRSCKDLKEIDDLPFPNLHTFLLNDCGVRKIDAAAFQACSQLERVFILRNQLSKENLEILQRLDVPGEPLWRVSPK